MTDATRLKSLKIALVLVGITFIAGIYLLMIVWPSGWVCTRVTPTTDDRRALCHPRRVPARRSPESSAHRSLIWFTVWTSGTGRSWRCSHSSVPEAMAISWGTCPRSSSSPPCWRF
jgi:hypothetical protein